MTYSSGNNEPQALYGYYPLYTTQAAAEAASPDGTFHTHGFDGTIYYMPNGVEFFHGDYSPTDTTSGGGGTDTTSGGGGTDTTSGGGGTDTTTGGGGTDYTGGGVGVVTSSPGNTQQLGPAVSTDKLRAYYADEPPDWDNLDGDNPWLSFPFDDTKWVLPLGFASVTRGQKYRFELKDLPSSRYSFNVKLWWSDEIESAYRIANVGWSVTGEKLTINDANDNNSRIIEAPAQFVYAAAVDIQRKPDAPDGTPEPSLANWDPYGNSIDLRINKHVVDSDVAVIRPEDLMTVQQDDTLYAIETSQLKEYFAPIAKPEDLVASVYGKPGIMFPGTGLQYDELTGEVDAVIPARPKFAGLIGIGSPKDLLGPYLGNADDLRDEINPIWNASVVTNTTGYEKEGDYYIVCVPNMILNQTWGFSSGASVNVGDVVIKVRHGNASDYGNDGNWEIMPSFEGYALVSALVSRNTALVIDTDTDQKFPQISILDAVPPDTINDIDGYSGFMSRDDKLFVDNVPSTYTNQDFSIYEPITDEEDIVQPDPDDGDE